MNEQPPSPVRLPGARIPEGTAPWRSADAQCWLAAVPSRRWAHPVWPLLSLVLAGLVVWLLPTPASTPDFSLFGTSAQPRLSGETVWDFSGQYVPGDEAHLGQTYTSGLVAVSVSDGSWFHGSWRWALPTLFQGLVLLEAYWTWRRPAVALAVLVPLTAAALLCDEVLAGTAPAARIVAGAAAGLVGLHLLHRVRARVRQRVRAVRAAGPQRHPLPASRVRGRRPFLVPAAAAVLLGVAAHTVTADRQEHSQWLLLVSGTLGTALLAHALANLWSAVRLRFHPQPALRVLVREGDDGKVWVYAADDTQAAEPLLGFRSRGTYEGEAPATGAGPSDAVREAVLYGVPASGAALAFVAAVDGPGGRVAVEQGTTPAAPARPHTLARTRAPARRRGTAHPRARTRGTARTEPRDGSPQAHGAGPGTPVTPAAPGAPRSWSAGPVSRSAGVLLLLLEAGVLWSLLDGERTWRLWAALLLLPASFTYLSTALNWRVTADRSGLWLAGGWRVRQLLWGQVEKVEHDDDSITFRTPDGAGVGIRPTGWARLERRTAAGHVAGRAAEEIRAMLADPELRPTEDSTPADQGMPLGPVIALVAVLVLAAALLL